MDNEGVVGLNDRSEDDDSSRLESLKTSLKQTSLRCVLALLDTNAVDSSSPDSGRSSEPVDEAVARRVLHELDSRYNPEANIDTEVYEELEKGLDLNELTKEVLESFMSAGILSDSDISKINEFFTIDCVEWTKLSYSRFLFLNREELIHSNQQVGSKSKLQISHLSVWGYVDKLKRYLGEEMPNREGHGTIHIDESTLKRVAAKTLIAHELGHVVTAMKYLEVSKKLVDRPNDSDTTNPIFLLKILGQAESVVRNAVFDKIAPNSLLVEIYGREDVPENKRISIGRETTSEERVAMSFEREGLLSALLKEGLSKKVAQETADKHLQIFTKRADFEFKPFMEFVRSLGFNWNTLNQHLEKLLGNIQFTEFSDPGIRYFVYAGFTPHILGYSFPLTDDELRAFLDFQRDWT